ncbi:MAG: hypothetical protein GY854_00055 [Deltaproteobacteria bacterium]|nr:hypothetical protein [Deltaproteobacteria bacterium]
MRSISFNSILFMTICFGLVSCSDEYKELADIRPDTGPDEVGDTDTGIDTGSDSDSETHTDTEQNIDTDSDTTFDQCGSVVDTAAIQRYPADIVIVVDNSVSMKDEASMVQQNMNGFSWQLAASGVDAHVVLISADSDDSRGICIAAPLGSGSCPDDSNPDAAYLHVPRSISSHMALSRIIDTYDDDDDFWRHMLRQEAILHFIVISDDDSGLSMEEFIEELSLLDPPIFGFTFHAIVASEDNIDDGPCEDIAMDEGVVYKALVAATGGVLGDLCQQEFQPVFTKLATEVGNASMKCEWSIPSPPEGDTFDPKKVNVEFDSGNGNVHQIGYVDKEVDCSAVEQGWYYDSLDEPTEIFVCDQTCEWMQGRVDAEITIIFGCKTKRAEPAV